MTKELDQITFRSEFSEIIQKNLKATKSNPDKFWRTYGVRIDHIIKKQNFLKIDSYFFICALFALNPVFTFIDIALKYVSAEILIGYINSKKN